MDNILNRCILQRVLNEFNFNDLEKVNAEELAGFLDARGVIIPPYKIGAKVWAYSPFGRLTQCTVTNISFDFTKNEWLIILNAAGGFPFGSKRVYASKEEALGGANNV